MPRVIPQPRGKYNARLGKGLLKLDPSRTGRLRKMFSLEARRRFSSLFLETRRLLDLTNNAFCPTGPGGGQDNSCSPHGPSSSRLEVLKVKNGLHQNVDVYKNPNKEELKNAVKSSVYPKGYIVGGDLYLWDSSVEGYHDAVSHDSVIGQLGIKTATKWGGIVGYADSDHKVYFSYDKDRKQVLMHGIGDPDDQDEEVKEWARLNNITLNLSSTQFNLEQQNLIDDVRHIQSLLDPNDVLELEDQPHITVRYGLHGQDAEQVQALYRNQLPIRVKLGGLSLFSSDKQDVLKIDVESRGLPALHSRLGLLPHTSTHPTYRPHLTIAYLKPGTGIKYVGESGMEGTELTFDRLVFSNDDREQTILENAFCPTGKGGGVDPTCSPNNPQAGFLDRAVTRTESFKKWFKDSKVVDDQGRPRILYHGTRAGSDFNEFKLPEKDDYPTLDQMLGTHLAEDDNIADQFASERSDSNSPRVYPVYASVQNPRIAPQQTLPNGNLEHDAWAIQRDIRNVVLAEDKEFFVRWATKARMVEPEQAGEIFDRLSRGESIGREEYNGVVGHYVDAYPNEHPVSGFYSNYDSGLQMLSYEDKVDLVDRYKSRLREMGYDGIQYQNTAPSEIHEASNTTCWIVFKPQQIKSALGNRGTFNPESGDIRNAFCPTGKGGGQDNSCGGKSEVLKAEVRGVSVDVYKNPTKEELANLVKAIAKTTKRNRNPASPHLLGDMTPLGAVVDGKLYVWEQVQDHYLDHDHVFASLGLARPASDSRFIIDAKKDENGNIEAVISPYYHKGAASEVVEWGRKNGVVVNARTKHQHVNRFMRDFNGKVKSTINDKPWWEEYVNGGYQTGVSRAYDDVKKPLLRPADARKEYMAAKREFLKAVVKATPDRVKKLYKDVQKDLDRITFELGQKLNAYLEQAVSEGKTLRQAVAEILPKLEAEGLRRAELVAQYRTVEAHAEGQLAAFEELGIKDLGVLVEWTTANNPCSMCSAMAGVVLRPAEAHGLIPRHPNCRCAWEVIASDDIDEDEHITDRSGIRRAIKASLKQGGRKGAKLKELLEGDTWGGSDVKYKGRPLFNEQNLNIPVFITEELVEFNKTMDSLRSIRNAFCPTGKGGGVDPTCSPSSTTKGGEALYSATRDKDKVWRLANGEPAPEHIQKLAIPAGEKGWRDVEINPDPNGTVYARGIDTKGRVQTRYSATRTAQQAAAKFGRTNELIKKRAQIYNEIERDAKNPELKEQAECLKLIMQTGMRPGSDKDTKADHKSYGATTLEGRHVIANKDGTVTLRLVTGKNKGREVDFPVTDKSTASMLKLRAKESGKEGRIFQTSAALLRDYSKTKDGGGFKTKDHRTALGTETALRAIKTMTAPTTMKDYKAQVKEVATRVSQTLGNTPPIALKSYIDPQVFVAWNKGLK